jgi:hypothetical protein
MLSPDFTDPATPKLPVTLNVPPRHVDNAGQGCTQPLCQWVAASWLVSHKDTNSRRIAPPGPEGRHCWTTDAATAFKTASPET